MRKPSGLLLMAVALLALASPVFAGGSQVYPNGAEGFWMGAAPPPGFYYLNYDLWYSSHAYNDTNGDEIGTGPLAAANVDVFANVSRFIYISETKILGANWGSHVFLVFKDVNLKTRMGNCHISGLGDAIIDPFILCWHSKNLHVTTGVDIYVPIGNYEAGRLANLGSNVFVYEPIVAVTYMTPMQGVTVSAKFMYDIPDENNDATHPATGVPGDLQYGQEFHFDYSVDYAVNDNLKVSLGGYFLKQTTNDEFNGADIHGQTGRVWAVGPGLEYAKGRFIVSYRTLFEIDARNRPEGIANWLRAVWVF